MARDEHAAVLITGASGFIGRAVSSALWAKGYRVRCAVQTPGTSLLSGRETEGATGSTVPEEVAITDISRDVYWAPILEGIDSIVHLAARVHVMDERGENSLAAFRRTNTMATENLARAAAVARVKRLVFLSTIKVHGERSPGRPFREIDPLLPADPYAVSKVEAEKLLHEVSLETGLQTVVLRPPLVYGPGVKGNFLRLMRWIARGVPLPLASIINQRSLLYVGNLADAISKAIDDPRAASETYLVSDDEDLSTPDLVRRIAHALGAKPRLFRCSEKVLYQLGQLLGRLDDVARLVESLQTDTAKIGRSLDWRPPYSVETGLAETARWYHATLR